LNGSPYSKQEKAMRPARHDWQDRLLILACSLFLYANLFIGAATPVLLGGDQVFFWMWGQRLLHGEQIYRDFFQFTPPGADLLYAAAFKLFGERIWVPNLLVLALGIALSWLCLQIAKSMLPRAQAALAASLYVVFIFGTTLNGTHHWLSLLAVTCAIAVLMKGTTATRVVIAGALLGLAAFITQTRGPTAAAAIALWLVLQCHHDNGSWRECLGRIALLFASLVFAWFLLSGYYIATIGLRELWFFQVSTVRELVVAGWTAASIGFPGLSGSAWSSLMQWLFAYVCLPTVYAICLWKLWSRLREEGADTSRLELLSLVGAAMFLEVAQSPSWLRFYAVSLPGVILLVWLVSGLGRLAPLARRALWIGIFFLAGIHTWHSYALNSMRQEVPAGTLATNFVVAEKLGWLGAHTQTGQNILLAQWPGLYLPLGLRNPIYLDLMAGAAASRPEYVQRSILELAAKRVEYIVLSPRFLTVDPMPPLFVNFLDAHYRLLWTFSDQDQVWARQP
jgi:hypothetical protein